MSIPAGPVGGDDLGSEASLALGLADLIATAGLATDDPHEGSGPAWFEGLGRLQHMSGSRCRALAPWDRGRWVAACCAAGTDESDDAEEG